VKRSANVDRWFKEKKPPAEAALQRVREIILRADPRVSESVKYGTVMFGYQGDLATFVQYNKPGVNVMFNRGAKIPGKFPHLEGSGPTARFMRFKSVAEVEARANEMTKVVRAWCAVMEPTRGK
jgi:hypothetical protein